MSGIMYRTSPVVIENNTLQAPSRRGPVRPVGAYFPIMTCVLYNIIPYI